jgi:hypothetical protein
MAPEDVRSINLVASTNSRCELKFLISEEVAKRIRGAAALRMDSDPHSDRLTERYPVHTIYLDSPDFALYRKSLMKEADRFKLRIRFYGDEPSPVFLEVKRSTHGRGTKSRVSVDRELASSLFAPGFSVPAASEGAFWEAVSRFQARPIIHIAYDREAFVDGNDSSLRLTMDREVRFEPAPNRLSTTMKEPVPIWRGKVILEVKFGHALPAYLEEMIRSLGLESTRASKYVRSLFGTSSARLGEIVHSFGERIILASPVV